MYSHFKCYPLSQFPLQKPPLSSLLPCFYEGAPSHLLIPTSLLWHSPTMRNQAFTGPRTSIHARQCHLLLHMLLEPWVPPCALFGWWFSPWELWGFWLVDIVVLPMRLQTHSAPTALSLLSTLGSTLSGQCLAVYIHICIGSALALTQIFYLPLSESR